MESMVKVTVREILMLWGRHHKARVCHFAFSFLSWRWQKVTWRAAWGKVSLDVSQCDRLGSLRHTLFPAL